MFEDNPPPLPATPTLETSNDETVLADFDDENRLTAVADNGYDSGSVKLHSAYLSSLSAGPDSETVNDQIDCFQKSRCDLVLNCKNSDALKVPSQFLSRCSSAESWKSSSSNPCAQNSKPHGLSSHVPEYYEKSHVLKATDVAVCKSVNASFDNESAGGVSIISCQHISAHDTDPVLQDGVSNEDLCDKQISEIRTHVGTVTEVTKTNSYSSHTNNVNDENKNMLHMEENDSESKLQDVDDDEFSDFGEFVETSKEETGNVENHSWANFESVPEIKSGGCDKLGQSVMIEGADNSIVKNLTFSTLLKNFTDDELWIMHSEDFDSSDEQTLPNNGLCETLNDAVEEGSKKRTDEAIWIAVSIIEEALALKMQWHDSSLRSYFLHSLNIDVKQAAIRNSGLPVFAQQLEESAILSPISATENTVSTASVDAKKLLTQSNSTDFLPRIQNEKKSIICHRAPPRSVTIDSLAVPPAQFDWNHFGLTNPLKTESFSVSSALLDLDFLASTSTSGTTSSGELMLSTLQKDLAAFGLYSSDKNEKSEAEKYTPNNTSKVLNCLLKNSDKERKYTPVSELSLDARALHDQLPDLDYMLSNVLLFPVINR